MGKHFEKLGDYYGFRLLSRHPSQKRVPLLGKPLSTRTAKDRE